MNSLKTFLIVLATLFALPWFTLVVYPSLSYRSLDQVPYAEEDEIEGLFPPVVRAGQRGEEIYARNGCAYCHTQVVRPTYAGTDVWRPGWGGRYDEGLARETLPHDYLGSRFAYLGVQRNGPDLSNVGWRGKSERWHFEHLFDPRSKSQYSIMPAFRSLFTRQQVLGMGSADAVGQEVENGILYEYVPSEDAVALVRYLMTMKKDAKVPQALLRKIREGEGS